MCFCVVQNMPLKDDDPEKWGYTEHTKIKHEILSKYLETWIRILGVKYKKLYYIDCFAGRGIYADGTAGSPIIALQSAKKMKKTFSYLCLLYTSDAADEEDSVDLGGRRII